jgi:oligo-1,6-glucosidase
MSDTVVPDSERQWWKEAVVYQIYPKSFVDSDGDGIGDLAGITERVDYLDDLGVDAVWLCPVYESPQADNGYDISDYQSIMDAYGDMDDWRKLLDALHERDIRLIMDLVVNHTSDEHAWFTQSRQSTDNDYRDYYIWREGNGEDQPNNWDSIFGGSAWTDDEATGEYYLHLFDEKQPDLNWENEAVREEVFEMMRWWLDQGIDGFRMDVINLISKTEGLPDGDPDGLSGAEHFMNGPKVHDYVSEMVDETIPNEEVLTVGETPGASVDDAREFVGPDGDGLSMVFQFEHVTFDHNENGKWGAGDWSLVDFKRVLAKWQDGLAEDGWNSLYLNNHDQPRMVSRFGDDDQYRRKSAKLLATLTHTLQGTPFIYQGEEIGMTNASFESPEELRDVESLNYVDDAIEHGDATSYDDVRDAIERVGRDNARTPMQWSDDEAAGFTDGEPWIKVNENYPEVNVERARADEDSVFHYYRALGDLRDERDLLVYGEFDLLYPDHDRLFAYTRTLGDERGLVVLNFSDEPTTFETPEWFVIDGLELALANDDDVPEIPRASFELGPYEARVYLTPELNREGDATRESDST